MPLDPPQVLLRKAQDDGRLAARLAADADVTDEHVGFLAQQAVEKSLKAVLSGRGIQYRRTHDLVELLDLLKVHGIAYPSLLDESAALTPFAAEMRYDYLPPEEGAEEPFDRGPAMDIVRAAVAWAERTVGRPEQT